MTCIDEIYTTDSSSYYHKSFDFEDEILSSDIAKQWYTLVIKLNINL